MAKQIKKKKHSKKKQGKSMRILFLVVFILLIGELLILHHINSNSPIIKASSVSSTISTEKHDTITSSPAPYETPHIISYESDEWEVRKLKQRMIELGWMKQNTEITGDYDVELQNAIRSMKEYVYNNWNSMAWGNADVAMPVMNTDTIDENMWILIYKRKVPAPTPIPSPSPTPASTPKNKSFGIWSLGYYVDDFGDKTDTPFISTGWISGKFSNTATTDSQLKACLDVTFGSTGIFDIYIQLDEYADGHIENMSIYKTCGINIKSKDGEKMHITGSCYKRSLSASIYSDKLHNALMKGGTLQFVVKCGNSQYEFTIMDADGYDNAYEKLLLLSPKVRATPRPAE